MCDPTKSALVSTLICQSGTVCLPKWVRYTYNLTNRRREHVDQAASNEILDSEHESMLQCAVCRS